VGGTRRLIMETGAIELRDVQIRLIEAYKDVIVWIQKQRAEGCKEKTIKQNLLQLRGIDSKVVDQLMTGRLPKVNT